MSDSEEFEFWIDAYSPETIAMKRLGEYMARLGRLLGQEDRVHFQKLKGGSTAIGYRVEREAVAKVAQRLEDVKSAEAANDAMYARDEINEMLRSDGAVAEIRQVVNGKPVPLLRLAGREIPKPERIGPFSEPASFKGELVRIEGADQTKHASIKDAQGRLWPGDMTLELAVQMRELLFELVLVEGTARWIRNEDGTWELKAFHIHNCKPLPKGALEDDIKALRGIAGNKWKDMPDPLGVIRESRNGNDEIH
jgi:hypothetical protein